ncbi:MAG: sugar phosphate isomerase/epimerase family protein [Phycisphaerae bacterium]
MDIGICTKPEAITASLDGLEYIEPTVKDLLCPAEDEGVFSQRLAALEACPCPAYAVNCLFPGSLKTTGPDANNTAVDEWFSTVCRRAEQAGVQYIVYGSGGSRTVPDGFDLAQARRQIVGHLKRFGPIAADCEVTLVLEPLNSGNGECNIVTSVREGAEIVAEVDHPAIRLLADTYHMAVDGEDPDAIREAGDLIEHVHAAEAQGRRPVGTAEDHRPYFAALKDISYEGHISIEARWDDFTLELSPAVRNLRKQWEEA